MMKPHRHKTKMLRRTHPSIFWRRNFYEFECVECGQHFLKNVKQFWGKAISSYPTYE